MRTVNSQLPHLFPFECKFSFLSKSNLVNIYFYLGLRTYIKYLLTVYILNVIHAENDNQCSSNLLVNKKNVIK